MCSSVYIDPELSDEERRAAAVRRRHRRSVADAGYKGFGLAGQSDAGGTPSRPMIRVPSTAT